MTVYVLKFHTGQPTASPQHALMCHKIADGVYKLKRRFTPFRTTDPNDESWITLRHGQWGAISSVHVDYSENISILKISSKMKMDHPWPSGYADHYANGGFNTFTMAGLLQPIAGLPNSPTCTDRTHYSDLFINNNSVPGSPDPIVDAYVDMISPEITSSPATIHDAEVAVAGVAIRPEYVTVEDAASVGITDDTGSVTNWDKFFHNFVARGSFGGKEWLFIGMTLWYPYPRLLVYRATLTVGSTLEQKTRIGEKVMYYKMDDFTSNVYTPAGDGTTIPSGTTLDHMEWERNRKCVTVDPLSGHGLLWILAGVNSGGVQIEFQVMNYSSTGSLQRTFTRVNQASQIYPFKTNQPSQCVSGTKPSTGYIIPTYNISSDNLERMSGLYGPKEIKDWGTANAFLEPVRKYLGGDTYELYIHTSVTSPIWGSNTFWKIKYKDPYDIIKSAILRVKDSEEIGSDWVPGRIDFFCKRFGDLADSYTAAEVVTTTIPASSFAPATLTGNKKGPSNTRTWFGYLGNNDAGTYEYYTPNMPVVDFANSSKAYWADNMRGSIDKTELCLAKHGAFARCYANISWDFGPATEKLWEWEFRRDISWLPMGARCDIQRTIWRVGGMELIEPDTWVQHSAQPVEGFYYKVSLTKDSSNNATFTIYRKSSLTLNTTSISTTGTLIDNSGVLFVGIDDPDTATQKNTEYRMLFTSHTITVGDVQTQTEIGPGIYRLDSANVYLTKSVSDKFTADRFDITIKLPATVTHNTEQQDGYTTSVLTGHTGVAELPTTGLIHELDNVYVDYNSSGMLGPVALGTYKHALVLSYDPTNGNLQAARYHWNDGTDGGTFDFTILSSNTDVSNGTPVIINKVTPWAKAFGTYNHTPGIQPNCYTANVYIYNHNDPLPTVIEDDAFYIVKNPSGTGYSSFALYFSSTFFLGSLADHQAMLHFRFNTPLDVTNIVSGRYLDGPSADPGSNASGTDTIIVIRQDHWNVECFIPNGTGGYHTTGLSAHVDYVNWLWNGVNKWVYPGCTPDVVLEPSWWPFNHIEDLPPNNIDETHMTITHMTQIEKYWYIPDWFHNHDDTDMSMSRWDMDLLPGNNIDHWHSIISRIDGIYYYPETDVIDSLPTPTGNNCVIGFSPISGSTIKYAVTSIYRDRDGALHTSNGVITPTPVGNTVLGSPADVNGPAGHFFPLTDWLNKQLNLESTDLASQPIGNGVMVDYQEVGVWHTAGNTYFDLALNTKHTQGSSDRHFEYFRVDFPDAGLAELVTGNTVCVWDDTDTIPDLIANMNTYLDNSIIIAREDFHRTRVYFVNPRVGGNDPVIYSTLADFRGYAFMGTTVVDDSWPQTECDMDIDSRWFNKKRIVPLESNISATNKIEINYDFATNSMVVRLTHGWFTGHYVDQEVMEAKFSGLQHFKNVFGVLDKVIIDPRGNYDWALNSDLYGQSANFTVGDIEVVFARDETDDSIHLLVVELRGDGVPIINHWDTDTVTNLGDMNVDVIEPTAANYYIYPRTDIDLGGELNVPIIEGETIEYWEDSAYSIIRPDIANFTALEMHYVAPVLTRHLNAGKLWMTFTMTSAAIDGHLDDFLNSTFVCITNKFYYADNSNAALPDDASPGIMVISKLLINMVRVHIKLDGTGWHHVGDYYVDEDGIVASVDPVTLAKPSCADFMEPRDCETDMIPDTSTDTEMFAQWNVSSFSNIELVGGTYIMKNREDDVESGDPVFNNIHARFELPHERTADSIRLSLQREPTGNNGWFTSNDLDVPTNFFIWFTPDTNVTFDDNILPNTHGEPIHCVAIPLHDVPSPGVHNSVTSRVPMALIDVLPTLNYDTVDLSDLLDGSQKLEVIISHSHGKAMVWLYEGDRLILRTEVGAPIPWTNTGTIGVHSHSSSFGIFHDKVSDLRLSYGPLKFDCLPPPTIDPKLYCEFVPSTVEQSIVTPIPTPNVLTSVYKPKPDVRFGYVHIDIINVDNSNARITLYKGNVDGTKLRMLREEKLVEKDQLMEVHDIRVLPDEALFVKTLEGSISIRCSSIEELFV